MLDNATGSLDSRTEAAVLDGLRRSLAGITTLMVAYRAQTPRSPTGSWCSSAAASSPEGPTRS